MAKRQTTRSLRPSSQITGVTFISASLFFVAGWVAILWEASSLLTFFYQPKAIAATHLFTLGWVSLTMMGVLHHFVPALTKCSLPCPALVPLQIGVFVGSSVAFVVSLWGNLLTVAAVSAVALLTCVSLFVFQLARPLVYARSWEATVLGIGAGLLSFLGAAGLGALFAIDKVWPILSRHVIRNIAGHAHLALLGWVTLTICAFSYRWVPAFTLPTVLYPRSATAQIFLLAVSAAGLVVTVLVQNVAIWPFAAAALVSLGWNLGILTSELRTRRVALDWSMLYLAAAYVHAAAAAACALVLLHAGGIAARHSRLVLAYGLLAFVGWPSNWIFGVGRRVLPGLMGAGGAPLFGARMAALCFALLNGGLIAAVASVLANSALGLRLASIGPLVAGAAFGIALTRRWLSALTRTGFVCGGRFTFP